MGYLTTVTVYNDGANELEKHPKEVGRIMYSACLGQQLSNGRNFDGLGSHGNVFTFQKPRHADDHTLYMHAGNTVIDVFNAKSDWAIDTFINEMEYHLKRLKKIKKDLKSK